MLVKSKVIAVTGGGNGIGRELILHLLEKGAKVAAIDINKDYLEETAALAGEKAADLSLHVTDITNRETVAALPEAIIAAHGAIDGIINNAGVIQPFVKVADLDYKKIEFVMNVNFYGTLYMVKSFLPYLLQRPEAHIVNISSMGGYLPVPGQSVYGASKAAVKLLTEGLYAELIDTNVRVTVVFPGGVATAITTNSGVEYKSEKTEDAGKKKQKAYKMLMPRQAAEIIVNGMEKNRFRVLAGQDAKFTDFLYRLSPRKATHMILKKMS
ncbi:MAG TPA: SDR family oxidoreductase [Acholeplasmataceae bacterium]|jgi:short-subunit dehydrogenase|nr:SDR family oxidoreductase [Acholeplasmataceae bacterium]